jgi:hypothetical protein
MQNNLVVVHYLHIGWTILSPDKTYSPLIVDANAVLPFAITLQCFQPICGRRLQKLQRYRAIQHLKFALSNTLEVGKSSYAIAFIEGLSVSAFEGIDHAVIILRNAYNVNRYSHLSSSTSTAGSKA